MALDYDKAIGFTKTGQTARITHTGAALYALSLGFGEDPMDQRELGFVLESRGPKTVPTMATVLAKGVVRDLDIDLRGVLHAEQRLRVLAPLPAQAELLMDTRVTSIIDKGPEAGAVVSYDIAGRDASDGRELFVLGYTLLARRDGGCGGPSGPAPQRRALPDRAPDARFRQQTAPNQALLYRLNGDVNPLHSDPETARRAGFERPILHGLCTYGMACRAVIAEACGHDADRISQFDARFTAPVTPGDRIETEIWIDGAEIAFRTTVPDTGRTVLDNGYCRLATAETAPREDVR